MVEETFEPGMTVSLVARRHGVAPNQPFTWRRLAAQGGLTAAGSGGTKWTFPKARDVKGRIECKSRPNCRSCIIKSCCIPAISAGHEREYAEHGAGTGGTPTVTDGRHAAAIALLGDYRAGSFVTTADGHGGTAPLRDRLRNPAKRMA